MNIQKKYWWVIGIVVPIVVAIVGIIPKLPPKPSPSVIGQQFNGQVEFNTVNIIKEQTRQSLGREMTEDVAGMLRKALELVQAKNFTEAIPMLESVAVAAPVPAVLMISVLHIYQRETERRPLVFLKKRLQWLQVMKKLGLI